uniref:Uncharacterized protein n=1 Tax=Oryza glumipatula TaxID=40148 RepID=A0A0E0BKG9_9ORYZ
MVVGRGCRSRPRHHRRRPSHRRPEGRKRRGGELDPAGGGWPAAGSALPLASGLPSGRTATDAPPLRRIWGGKEGEGRGGEQDLAVWMNGQTYVEKSSASSIKNRSKDSRVMEPSELHFEVGRIDMIYLGISSWHAIMAIIDCPDLINRNLGDISGLVKIKEV